MEPLLDAHGYQSACFAGGPGGGGDGTGRHWPPSQAIWISPVALKKETSPMERSPSREAKHFLLISTFQKEIRTGIFFLSFSPPSINKTGPNTESDWSPLPPWFLAIFRNKESGFIYCKLKSPTFY